MTHRFEAELYPWTDDKSTWVFLSLPEAVADAVEDEASTARGFGSVRVLAGIGATEWHTSLFPSKELGTFVLPVKKAVREAEELDVGDTATVSVAVVADE